jgi:hypothetical protein
MSLTTAHLRAALERSSMGYQPRPQTSPRIAPGARLPLRSLLPPVPWLIRGNNAALVLGTIVLATLFMAWLIG